MIPIIEANQEKFLDDNESINEEIRLIETPGHTPHHVSVSIESKGERVIISGDFFHHPCQIAHPEWLSDVETYPKQALETRYKMLKILANSDILLIGSHFANPVVGKIVRDQKYFVFKTD